MLNEMRFGTLTQKSIQAFRSLSRPIEYDDGLGPTELYVLIISSMILSSPLADFLEEKMSSDQTPPVWLASTLSKINL